MPVTLGSQPKDIIPFLKKFSRDSPIKFFYLKASLSGGPPRSNIAWQRAQLFRTAIDDYEASPLKVCLIIDRMSFYLSFV